MTKKVSIGGNRLGSGNKMDLELRNFERSNHDLGYIWRSTMACGTLVPFMSEVGLPGDTFDIDLNALVKTYPTVGPLYGSFKLQLDVFSCPMRLYQGLLHNNPLGIGMKMGKVYLPQVQLKTIDLTTDDIEKDINTAQINPSSILSYLGIKGIGHTGRYTGKATDITRLKNATSWLAYWDIYKNYYANKQEEIGAMIAVNSYKAPVMMATAVIDKDENSTNLPTILKQNEGDFILVTGKNLDKDKLVLVFRDKDTGFDDPWTIKQFTRGRGKVEHKTNGGIDYIKIPVLGKWNGMRWSGQVLQKVYQSDTDEFSKPVVLTFELKNIDDMRSKILSETEGKPITITHKDKAPYGTTINIDEDGKSLLRMSQQGLGLKTYQSDIFNNWVSTEWIEGTNGIAEVTAVDVKDGKLKIDALILAKKVHNMLSRVAVSGGSYYDWINAVYSESTSGMNETPMYLGGMSQEIIFEEVISNAEASQDQPLGTLAGKGNLANNRKGGKIYVKVTEPSYIIGIVSITPRVDYSQGNRWDTSLKTLDDLHKPSLDGIGFQDLVTDKMAWWDTQGESAAGTEEYKSAGKQPAWLDYMTNYNMTFGHFANINSEMFMTLNRRYEVDPETGNIADLTTYIDPSKFNYAFAMTDLTSQNFWVQIGLGITARRKISAKQIPNL